MSIINAVVRFFIWLGETLFRSLSFCALAGAMIGVIVGFLFGLVQTAHPAAIFTPFDLTISSLLLALVGFIVVLVIFGVWQRYGVRAIFLPALINALATAFLTVYVNDALRQSLFAAPVGLLIGILVGSVLCALCAYFPPRPDLAERSRSSLPER